MKERSSALCGESKLARGGGDYKFINPLLSCEIAGENVEFRELAPFKQKIEAVIARETSEKRVLSMSAYFRDLNNGPWYGINEHEDFAPGSLLKVPLMIAWLKEAESDPALLRKTFVYDGKRDENAGEFFKPSKTMQADAAYTVDELLYRMIVYSDNNATSLLLGALSQDVLAKAYTDLGLLIPGYRTWGDPIPVKRYAAFFRILFNASYLEKNLSEEALDLLAQNDFRQGLVAGVPPNIAVAHKFGEKAVEGDGGLKQLHDCGIIYYPKHPYLLCIMSRGKNIQALASGIKDISAQVYNEVSEQYKEEN